MILRRMEKKDIFSVVQIEKCAFKNRAWSEQLFFDEILDNTKVYFVAEVGEEVVAYGGFAHILDEAHIMNVAVNERFRRQGFATRILAALEVEMHKLNIKCATLEVNSVNLAAIELYRLHNFILEGKRKDYYARGEDALIFWKYF